MHASVLSAVQITVTLALATWVITGVEGGAAQGVPRVQGDRLGRVASGQGLLDPAAPEAVGGDAAAARAGCASGAPPGLEDGAGLLGGGCRLGGLVRLLLGLGHGRELMGVGVGVSSAAGPGRGAQSDGMGATQLTAAICRPTC